MWLASAAWAALPVGLYLLSLAQPQDLTFFDIIYEKTVRETMIPELLYASSLVWAGGALLALLGLALARGVCRRRSDKIHVSAFCALLADVVAAVAASVYIIARGVSI